jgi:hypothetical protein
VPASKDNLARIAHLDFLFDEPRFINALDPDRTEKAFLRRKCATRRSPRRRTSARASPRSPSCRTMFTEYNLDVIRRIAGNSRSPVGQAGRGAPSPAVLCSIPG